MLVKKQTNITHSVQSVTQTLDSNTTCIETLLKYKTKDIIDKCLQYIDVKEIKEYNEQQIQ